MTAPGEKFGRFTVLEVGHRVGCHQMWKCRCECGTERLFRAYRIRAGKRTSCGCLQARHGLSRTPHYAAWKAMRARCLDPTDIGYKGYGGRGIVICTRWDDLATFVADMGPKPSPSHSIERIDNDGNYEPGNCRWATQREQNLNKRSNRMETFEGKTKPLQVWADERKMPWYVLRDRLERGWGMERALGKPYKPRGRRPKP